MTVIYSILSFILILLPLVILHEFGHYFSAKFFKIKVLNLVLVSHQNYFLIASKKLIYFDNNLNNLDLQKNKSVYISTEFKRQRIY